MGEFNSLRSKFAEEKLAWDARVATLEQTNSALRADVEKATTSAAPSEDASKHIATIVRSLIL
jgi:hypothetical protein